MFFAVVQPMASTPSSNDALKLIGLHPDNFLNTFVTPELQAEEQKEKSIQWLVKEYHTKTAESSRRIFSSERHFE